jgi:glycosyltransferase involved in cell wall biosynthesis
VTPRARVTHVIGGLEVGGAERLLLELLARSDRSRFESDVISLTTLGPVGRQIQSLGVRVTALGASRPWMPSALWRLARLLRRTRPDVVQTWMYHADLAGGLAASLAGIEHIVWGIHTGRPAPEGLSPTARLGIRAAASLSSRVPERIVACSNESSRVHTGYGYASERMVVIQNGFSLDAPAEAIDLRSELALPDDALLVGRIARDHPQKDIPTLLACWPIVARRSPRAHLVVAGAGLTSTNEAVARRLHQLPGAERVHLLGPREDARSLHAAFDVEVSSSAFGEGLPLVLGEAMTAGTPVVSTDVGDSADLIGDPRRIVPPRDPAALAEAVLGVLSLPAAEREALGSRDRHRVSSRFDLDTMVERYGCLYLSLIGLQP